MDNWSSIEDFEGRHKKFIEVIKICILYNCIEILRFPKSNHRKRRMTQTIITFFKILKLFVQKETNND